MLVSWDWLKQYVPLPMTAAELEHRLAMSGLNHESSTPFGRDLVIELEVTSNRPDCLGHLGVAREIAVLFDQPLQVPAANPEETANAIDQLTRVRIDCPELCYRYTARVVEGVKIKPSPDWLARRLESVGVARVNNVVDISNYVMLECGQPLHAFDLNRLQGPEIIVREARPGERFEAIDHKMYDLQPGMCVIADARDAVALGGVMGGAHSEVVDSTTNLLIEAAEFAPLSVRNTARKLNLHSPSSYRFERGIDPEGVDWASRRCCELILECGGGQLATGVLDEGREPAPRGPIVLRLSQLKRILGIEIAVAEVVRILEALGGDQVCHAERQVEMIPPSWRRDLTREVDLVEEVARIHGYDQIPEDVGVPMAPSHRTDDDRVLVRLRQVLTAAGFDEAMTASMVPEEWAQAFGPWTDQPALQSEMPLLKGADRLRCSLVPSLLECRRLNQSLSNPVIELFETARIYLPSQDKLPREQRTLAIVSGGSFGRVKGVIEAVLDALHIDHPLELESLDTRLLDPDQSCRLMLNGKPLGYLGGVTEKGGDQFRLRGPTTVAELDIDMLAAAARLVPKHQVQSPYPAISRDLNFIVDESLQWASLSESVRTAVGGLLETLEFREIYRDPQKDGAGKKRMFFSITLRSDQRTLTGEEADQIRQSVVDRCSQHHGAVLLG